MTRFDPETRYALYQRAIKTYGQDAQWRQVQEECAELIAAVNRYRRGRIPAEELAGEIADVRIMFEQAMLLIDGRLVDSAFETKLTRLKDRLDAEDQT
jgi:NTP pyrophosphatase (non-canonical NTP hydrolase)